MQHRPQRRLRFLLTFVALLLFGRVDAAEVRAITGEPFGVAQITLPYPVEDVGLPGGRCAMTCDGPVGRVHYPAVTDGVVRRLLGSGPRRGANLTVMFLYRGDSPFDVTVGTPTRQTITVEPERGSQFAYRRMLKRWWRGYTGMFRELAKQSEHPPVIETYLTSMLARRLGFDGPLASRLTSEMREEDEGHHTLELLAGAETVRTQIIKATSLGVLPAPAAADLPLPDEVKWRASELPVIEGDVEIEPLAMRVPEECFYVRFGQYSNFFWLNTLMEDYGGEIGNMVSARGHRTELSQRIQDQLAMEHGVLAELLGPQAISDVAAIGLDTFTRDGAAIGILFEVRGPLLAIDLARQRREALARERDQGASLKNIKIGGRDVSLLSTPDNHLRSYYVVDGKYHLVTNSRTIVKRFLEVAGGEGSLGANEEYRYARSVMPTNREDTIFVYFSSQFFRNLLSPRYQIEMVRRLQAATDVQLLTLARLAAEAEGVPGKTIDDLIAADLLPQRFGVRPDQSHPEFSGARVVDSLRGERGFFTPVPDVVLETVSADERQRYLKQASYYAENSQHVDPILIALKRYALEEELRERITFDAFLTPMDGFRFRLLMSMLGEPSSHKLVPPKENIVCIDAAVRGGILFQSVPPHRLFLGLQDHKPLAGSTSANVLRLLQIVRTAPGILGAWPKPGFLDLIPFISGVANADGISQLPLSVLRWQGRGFSVLSMDKEILAAAGQQLGFVEEDYPAQVRVHVGDLSTAKFARWLNQMGYERARQVSVGNARAMSVLHQQLKFPLDQTQAVAEELVGARLVCALGGKYEVIQRGGGPMMRSTAWPATTDYSMPDQYVSPSLEWFRGLEARLVKYPERLVLHGYVDMHRKERESAITLPLFNLLGGDNKTQKSKPGEPAEQKEF